MYPNSIKNLTFGSIDSILICKKDQRFCRIKALFTIDCRYKMSTKSFAN